MMVRRLYHLPAALLLIAAAPPAPPAAEQPKPAAPINELQQLRAEVASLRQQLDRQQLIADNAREELHQAREQAKLRDELLVLGRERNAELLTLGREILARFRSKGLGDVLAGSEPFVQSSRVKLENLVQDYEDKLRAARFTAVTLPPSVEARMRNELRDGGNSQPAAAADQH